MIFREVILFCWREIKRRWKREIIFGAEESKSKKTKEVYIGDQNYVIAVEKINGRGKRG